MHSSFFHFSFRIGTRRPRAAPWAIVVLSGVSSTREFQENTAGQPKTIVLASNPMKVINDSFVAQSSCEAAMSL
jgi:hypothetical protein